jgi:hypothetical protein
LAIFNRILARASKLLDEASLMSPHLAAEFSQRRATAAPFSCPPAAEGSFLSLNRKKLAISAAVVGGIVCPTWTGNWHLISQAVSAFDRAHWREAGRQAEERFFAEKHTTPAEFYKDEWRKCEEYKSSGQYELDRKNHEKETAGSMWALFSTDPSQFNGDRGIVNGDSFLLRQDSASSYFTGVNALLDTLAPLGFNILIGSLVASLIVSFSPGAVRRYFRWLHTS